jgi:aspartate aminotransferase
MEVKLSKRILTLAPSPTVTIDTKVKAMQQQGIPVLNMGIGEPDFDTPSHIKKAANNALEAGFTKYAAPQGLDELRIAIADKFERDNNIDYDPSEIIIGTGSKQLLYSVFQVLCDKGDEVIIPLPAWSTFSEQVKLADAKPVFIPLTAPFKLTAEVIKKHITKKTKILLLNSPSNPTGAMIDPAELEKIADVVIQHNLWVIFRQACFYRFSQRKNESTNNYNEWVFQIICYDRLENWLCWRSQRNH